MSVFDQITLIMRASPRGTVFSASDFKPIGSRTAVDKALCRLKETGIIRRIDTGLYDVRSINPLTGRLNPPKIQQIIAAVARRGNLKILPDGQEAAFHLRLTNAAPDQQIILVNSRVKPITVANLTIQFRRGPEKLFFWSGRPAARLVMALIWLRDIQNEEQRIQTLHSILARQSGASAIERDLIENSHHLPAWLSKSVKKAFS